MNKIFLTFDSPELETQYQLAQSQHLSFKFYLTMVFICLVMNTYILIAYFINPISKTWQINAVFIVVSLIQIIVFVIMKRRKYTQLAMTFTNLMLAFLEMNIDSNDTSKTEFYSYGNISMQLQGIIYVISDFRYVVIQVIGHLAIRSTITVTNSNHVNSSLLILGIIAAIFIISSSYLRNVRFRLFFMQNLKDTQFDKIFSFLISEPFFKITFSSKNSMFQVSQNNQIHKFPGYNNEQCEGCNVRNILRQYRVDNSGTLESLLIGQVSLPQSFKIQYKRDKIQVKISQLDPNTQSYIVILEQKQQTVDQSNKEEKKLKRFLKQSTFFHQKFMTWGIFSLLYLNSRVMRKVNLKSSLKRLLIIYKQQIYSSMNLEIFALSESNIFCTYFHQIQIFMIQLFDSIVELQKAQCAKVVISLKNEERQMKIMIVSEYTDLLKTNLNNNYFISKISHLLMHHSVTQSNNLTLYFKKYASHSFLHSED